MNRRPNLNIANGFCVDGSVSQIENISSPDKLVPFAKIFHDCFSDEKTSQDAQKLASLRQFAHLAENIFKTIRNL